MQPKDTAPSRRSQEDVAGPGPAAARRPYAPPRLEVLGDVRDITLGASPGVADSTPINTQPL